MCLDQVDNSITIPDVPFVGYKVVGNSNHSPWLHYLWTVGVHETAVFPLDRSGFTSCGFYVCKTYEGARKLEEGLFYHIGGTKIIAVHVNPTDVIYRGLVRGEETFVCRRVEIKSLDNVRESFCEDIDVER